MESNVSTANHNVSLPQNDGIKDVNIQTDTKRVCANGKKIIILKHDLNRIISHVLDSKCSLS